MDLCLEMDGLNDTLIKTATYYASEWIRDFEQISRTVHWLTYENSHWSKILYFCFPIKIKTLLKRNWLEKENCVKVQSHLPFFCDFLWLKKKQFQEKEAIFPHADWASWSSEQQADWFETDLSSATQLITDNFGLHNFSDIWTHLKTVRLAFTEQNFVSLSSFPIWKFFLLFFLNLGNSNFTESQNTD